MRRDTIPIAVAAAAISDDPREAPHIARQSGFGGLQFESFSSRLNLPDLSGSGRREFRHLLSAQSQQLVGLRGDVGPKGFGPGADVDRLLSRLQRAMEAAAALQAPLLCLDGGPLPPAPPAVKPRPRITADQAGLILLPTLTAIPAPDTTSLEHVPAAVDPTFAAQVGAALADLGQRADRLSVTIAFRSDLASFAAMEQALRQANCPWFGIDLDPPAVLRDDWSLDEVFSRLGPLIRHVRGRDAVAGPDRWHTRPTVIGQGSTNWEELLSNLDSAGYQGWITLDPLELPDRAAAGVAGLKYLKKLRPHRG